MLLQERYQSRSLLQRQWSATELCGQGDQL
jgi:hypothetical protein